jgi:hypothetical protein
MRPDRAAGVTLRHALPLLALAGALAAGAGTAHAQLRERLLTPERVQRVANGVLSLMAYTVAPDVTTSSLSISDAAAGNPDLAFTQFGGGFVVSDTYRVYLEGNAAYARFDPKYVVSDGVEEREIPTRWNSVSATGGVGYDFPISSKWTVRPIFNFTLGRVTSDLRAANAILGFRTGRELEFLDGGILNAYGLGGSLMAVYKYHKPEREYDLEARYTNVRLHSYGDSSDAVVGKATAESASLWARMRVPTGMMAMERPVRYVFELAASNYFDSGVEALGFTRLLSLGIGLELDSSKYDLWFNRWRATIRHVMGDGVSGWSLGLAASF